jgi:ABC-2 type transport system permease protein
MNNPGTLAWFAAHEGRLAWRDWLWLITAGRRRSVHRPLTGFLVFAALLHGVAYLALKDSARWAGPADRSLLVPIAGTLVMTGSLMLSQALESVTRAFYSRGDLELILTSPASASRLFAVRILSMPISLAAMVLLLGAPFINIMAWLYGFRWLAAYPVILALAMSSVALALIVAVALFRMVGARRTRMVSQILAAIVGAAFAIAMQFALILSYGSLAGTAAQKLELLNRLAPGDGSVFWWPAQAVLGEVPALWILLVASTLLLAGTLAVFSSHFGQLALAAGSLSQRPTPAKKSYSHFRYATAAQALRRKEWTLLLRDPWLLSQTLMQLLYLAPPAFLLWRNFYSGSGAALLLAPVIIMAAGQMGGGLAWLAVSGEDAPDLIASAPLSVARILRAKTEAVMGGVALIFLPLTLLLAIVSPFSAVVAGIGLFISAASATAIQYWFRTQAKRTLFRRRQTSSRIATFAEALSSVGWAGAGALAAARSWLALIPCFLVLLILAGAWMISPARKSSA